MILAQPASRFDPGQVEDALERAYRDVDVELTVQERIARFLGDLLQRLFDFAGSSGWFTWLAWALVIGLLVGLVWFVVRRAGLTRNPEAPLLDLSEPDVDWHELAREAEARGDLDAALRAGYRALLVSLVGRGLVPDRRSLTAAEARDAVETTAPALGPGVDAATRAFERVAYARHDVEPDDVRTMRRVLEEVGR